LRLLVLRSLPELKTICSSSNVIVCETLQEILITRCPKLKRLCLTNGKLSSPPSSLKMLINKECWELLEWDHPDMKNALEPLCQFVY
jgi:disease resistance protein RPS2